MLPFRLFLEQDKHKFSCVHVVVTEPQRSKILEFVKKIPESVLAADGREDDPHITCKYGLYTSEPRPVELIVDHYGKIKVKLGKTSFFPANEKNDFDVLKISVESPDLHRLNKLICSKLANESKFPYTPHLTLAYLKKGFGNKYTDNAFMEGEELTFDSVVFSNQEREKKKISLIG